ncbi:MAG: helix-turn-helix domain-containing protein [Candidatus Obscuribacterales bacterium]|nr:helix-turn-helix domain-containing protein [Candidatus Obscuribacterales bacterium]
MTQNDMLSINTVAARLGLSVHQLRRWELMFGLEIKRGRGQQRQYRAEDLTVLERIKELVEQGWPTSQIRPQLEAEGLITPKLIGMPQQPGNPEMLMEAIIGLRSFAERRFIEISRQIDELRQLMISITLKQELRNEISSPWQPIEEEFAPPQIALPAQEISIGPAVANSPPMPIPQAQTIQTGPPSVYSQPPPATQPPPVAAAFDTENGSDLFDVDILEDEAGTGEEAHAAAADPVPVAKEAPRPVAATPSKAPPILGEITDQNYLTLLGKALDLVGWSDDQADGYSQSSFGVAHWDELGRSQAEKLIDHLMSQLLGPAAS